MHVKPAGLPHVTFFFITGDVLEIAFTITVVWLLNIGSSIPFAEQTEGFHREIFLPIFITENSSRETNTQSKKVFLCIFE